MSVRSGMSNRALIAASTRNPSFNPGPRKDRPDVRLALSYDALKINGTPTRDVISTSRAASMVACASLSITHGPAISANGLPPPIVMLRSVTLDTRSGHRFSGWLGDAGHLVTIGRVDKRREQ